MPAFADDETFISRFRRDAETPSRLLHPNVVQVLDFIHQRTDHGGRPLGLVHRELNPPSVLLSVHREVELAGLVRDAMQAPVPSRAVSPEARTATSPRPT